MAALHLGDKRGNDLALDTDEARITVTVDSTFREYWQMIQLTPAQARAVAAQLVILAAEIEAPDGPPDQVL